MDFFLDVLDKGAKRRNAAIDAASVPGSEYPIATTSVASVNASIRYFQTDFIARAWPAATNPSRGAPPTARNLEAIGGIMAGTRETASRTAALEFPKSISRSGCLT